MVIGEAHQSRTPSSPSSSSSSSEEEKGNTRDKSGGRKGALVGNILLATTKMTDMMSKMDEGFFSFLTQEKEHDQQVQERQMQHELQMQDKQDRLFLKALKILKSHDEKQ